MKSLFCICLQEYEIPTFENIFAAPSETNVRGGEILTRRM